MPDFTNFIKNRSLTCTTNSFEPLALEPISGPPRNPERLRTGAILQPNGDVLFRIFAPKAQTVEISIESLSVFFGGNKNILELEKTGEDFTPYILTLENYGKGIFEGTLSYIKEYYGPLSFTVIVDSAEMASPYAPVLYRSGRNVNIVEIPDPELDAILIKDVPQGAITYETYWSDTTNNWTRCLIYTPPGYKTSGKDYPVIYLQHGGGENETSWTFLGKLPQIMDNLIYEGKAEPCLIVMSIGTNDGLMMRVPPDADSLSNDEKVELTFERFSRLIIDDCIPFVEKEYRVKIDKWNRAVAGLSMGSMQSSYLGFGHPELFGSIGLFSSSIRCRRYWTEYADNKHLEIMRKGSARVAEEYKVIYRGVGQQELDSRPWHSEDDAYLADIGVDQLPCYYHKTHPYACHEWGTFRRSFYDFVQLIFK